MSHDPISTRTGVIIVVILLVFLFFAFWAASSKAQTPPKPIRCSDGYCLVPEATMIIILNDAVRAYEYAKWCRWIKDR